MDKKEDHDANHAPFSKRSNPKLNKKVSFDTKVHHMNFARKSTSARKRSSISRKRMFLNVVKSDITGYRLPRSTTSEPESGLCARLMPVEDVLSRSRTNPAHVKHKRTPVIVHQDGGIEGTSWSTFASHAEQVNLNQILSNLRNRGGVKKRRRDDSAEAKDGKKKFEKSDDSIEDGNEPVKKKKRSSKKKKKYKKRDVFGISNSSRGEHHRKSKNRNQKSSPIAESFASPADINYDMKLNETIEKIKGKPENGGNERLVPTVILC